MKRWGREGVLGQPRRSFWGSIPIAIGFVAFAAALVAVMVAAPLAGLAIIVIPFFLFYPEMPTFWILVIVVSTRALIDGMFNFSVGGTTATAVAGVTLVALGIAIAIRGGRGVLTAVLILLALVVSNSFAVTTFGSGVRDEIIRTASIISVVLIVLNSRTDFSLARVGTAVQVIAAIPAFVAVFQAVTGTGLVVEGVVRPAGTLAHPNSAAVLFGVAATATLMLLSKGKTSKPLGLGLLILFCSALLGTASMGGLLTFVVMTLALAVFSRTVSVKKRAAYILLLVITALVFVASPIGAQRIGELSDLDISGSRSSANSLEWRIGNWQRILDYWHESPAFGQGFGATTTGAMMNGFLPHNEYVRLLIEIGVIGCAFGVLAVLALACQLFRAAHQGNESAGLAALGIALFAGMIVNCFGANTLLYSVPTYAGAILISAALSRGRKTDMTIVSDLMSENRGAGNQVGKV